MIADITVYLFLSFEVVYLEQVNCWIFRIKNSFLLKLNLVSTKYMMRLHLIDCCNMSKISRKRV